MNVAGLFAGIGGIELGLAAAGHRNSMLCENDPAASAVLAERFPDVHRRGDVRDLELLPRGTELLTAGFPCQDLSQAGETLGLRGRRSGLISEVFRLLATQDIPWVLLENVPFMLQLARGAAMDHVISTLEGLGYRWAYRVIDARAFGLPQRRERVFLLASRVEDPSPRLLGGNVTPPEAPDPRGRACGFYWTEGRRGLGWAIDAVPTLKGGSTVGIPSPPAIWMPDGRIVTPDLRDAERLQGFPADWTLPAESVARRGQRWKLVGNAVSVPVLAWIGFRLAVAPQHEGTREVDLEGPWPKAARGGPGSRRRAVAVTTWPVREDAIPLGEFLRYEPKALSLRAASGFDRRFSASGLRAPEEFRAAIRGHIERLTVSTSP